MCCLKKNSTSASDVTKNNGIIDELVSFLCVEIDYVHNCLKHNLKPQELRPDTKSSITGKLHWTADKINLVELIYALIHANCINNGKVKIKDVIEVFQTLFSVDLGEYYRSYVEVKRRKLERGKFMKILLDAVEENIAKSYRK